MIENHWGKWVDSEEPITGVISNHSAEYLTEESLNGIDLSYKDFIVELQKEHNIYAEHDRKHGDGVDDHSGDFEDCEACEQSKEYYEDLGEGTYLVGFWRLIDGKYEPDTSEEYAAIYSFPNTQVVWSKWSSRAALCSPCYPGQGDLDNAGEYLTYTLPPDMFGSDDTHLPIDRIGD